LLAGTYQPQPVSRVEIPEPDGGVRKLGVPCVVDSTRWLSFFALGFDFARSFRE
jgi:hypothetical protein